MSTSRNLCSPGMKDPANLACNAMFLGGSFLKLADDNKQGCISCEPCSCPELTEDHVLPSAYVEIFRTVTRNAVNKSFWRKKDCSWPPLNKYAMNIWLSSLKIRAHLSWRTGKHLHVLHVLRTYSTCSCPGQQDTTTYAALYLIAAQTMLPNCDSIEKLPYPSEVNSLRKRRLLPLSSQLGSHLNEGKTSLRLLVKA